MQKERARAIIHGYVTGRWLSPQSRRGEEVWVTRCETKEQQRDALNLEFSRQRPGARRTCRRPTFVYIWRRRGVALLVRFKFTRRRTYIFLLYKSSEARGHFLLVSVYGCNKTTGQRIDSTVYWALTEDTRNHWFEIYGERKPKSP